MLVACFDKRDAMHGSNTRALLLHCAALTQAQHGRRAGCLLMLMQQGQGMLILCCKALLQTHPVSKTLRMLHLGCAAACRARSLVSLRCARQTTVAALLRLQPL